MAFFFGDVAHTLMYTPAMGRPRGSKNKITGQIKFPTCYVEDDATGCWNWIRSRGSHGYGDYRYDGHKLAHRWSYATFNGPIPDGLWVLHRCDNHACVNPTHLFLGDADANNKDMVEKRRHYSKGKTLEEVYGAEEAARKRARLSQHLLANPFTAEARARAVEKTRGQTRSPEQRARLSEGLRRAWRIRKGS